MYTSSVKVFFHYLKQLSLLLQEVESAVQAGTHDESTVLQAQLAPGMFSMSHQSQTAIGFSLRTCYPLVGEPIPELPEPPDTLAGLQQHIQKAQDFLNRLRPEQFINAEERTITTKAGFAELELSGSDFLNLYALPNFFFHLSMVYAIQRQQGISIGKSDFDGFHQYPSGFSFLEE